MKVRRIELLSSCPEETILCLRHESGERTVLHCACAADAPTATLLAEVRRQVSRMPETIASGHPPLLPDAIHGRLPVDLPDTAAQEGARRPRRMT